MIFFVGLMAVFLGIGIAFWRTRPSRNLLRCSYGVSQSTSGVCPSFLIFER
jgi:hypothetical protein